MIPKILHCIWIGDASRRPGACIDTWRTAHPDFEFIEWGNDELFSSKWYNASHIDQMAHRELNGVADLMRYEILYHYGGIFADADSYCLRPLPDWIREPNEFAFWENEFTRPGLIGTCTMGASPHSPFFAEVIRDIHEMPTVVDRLAWITVGPGAITRTWRRTGHPLTIYPSHYFSPDHFSGRHYDGGGHVFASQLWGNTLGSYDNLASARIYNRSVTSYARFAGKPVVSEFDYEPLTLD